MSKRAMKIVIGVLAVALIVVGGLAVLKNLNGGALIPGSSPAASSDAEPDAGISSDIQLSTATPSDTEE